MSHKREQISDISILYVEDDEVIQSITAQKLSKTFTRLYTAKNGLEGLNKFKANPVDIVLTDINMPELNGIEMIAAIKEISQKPHFIVLTAYSESNVIIDAIEVGVDKYLVKPASMSDLIEMILSLRSQITLEKNLYSAMQHYDALIKFFIISKTDTAGIITFANQQFADISGYSIEELIGKNHNIVRHPDMDSALFEELWSTIKKKQVWKGKIKNRKKDGGEYIVDATIFPILTQSGEIQEFMAIRQDVTELELLREKAKAEEEALRAKEEQNRVLEEVNRTKDSFLVIFTHELKTPLNAIINFSDYAIKKLQDPNFDKHEKISDLLESVKRNGIFMLQMVTNLLEVARLKAGKTKIEMKHFSINETLKEIIDSFRSIAQEENIEVALIEEEHCFIKSDPTKVKQIFSNLISNALKYGKSSVYITVGSGDGGIVFVSIEDNGKGIINREKVFELYGQDGVDVKKETTGSGVGLYLVKLLSDELDLGIQLESSDALGGAKFTITFSKEERS